MAFTRNWSSATPLGSTAANQIDDKIREKMVDIEERLESAFVNIDNDPMILKAASLPTGVSVFPKVIGWEEGSIRGIDGSIPAVTDYQSDTSDSVHPDAISETIIWVIGLSHFQGQTPASISAWVYRDAGATVSINVKSATRAAPPVIASLGSAVSASTGWHALAVSGLATLLNTAVRYYVMITLTSDGSNANSARLQNILVDD